ncbi:flavin reductase family protein [Devosia aurantiaca]|uniref:flavin reductase family protein n=1 Tax=Devosia aurantiaca TaxID=2714858 RepID=UPI001F21D07D|nr:iron-sulfur cluster-binding domain-containing protein [Devosia aurantiaca]
MARFLDKSSLPYELHYFVRNGDTVAFQSELEVLHGRVDTHVGLGRELVKAKVAELLGPYQFANHVYICGPGSMLEMVQETATALGWPDEAIHFEYFQNTKPVDASSAFDVELARSAMTLHVPAGKTILETMRDNGLTVASSCEQGACGTCLTGVIEGEVDHQDVYLNRSEKASNTCIMTCVSRAKGERLVLDI